MRLSPLLRALLFCLSLAALVGCGSGPAATVTQAPAPSANLGGNWLLAGTLPQGSLPLPAEPQLSVTLSVVGQQVTGLGVYSLSCSISGTSLRGANGGTLVLTGVIAADDSFVLQSPPPGLSLPNGGVAISITGKVPLQAGGSWQGSYAIDTTSEAVACPQKVGGAISSTAIAPISGTYMATGTYVQGVSSTPTSVAVTLQQGVQVTSGAGVSFDYFPALSGSITVQGVPCFHSGTIPPLPTTLPAVASGSVFGGRLFPVFKMDDGSSVTVQGSVSDPAGDQLQQSIVSALSGACSVSSGAHFNIGSFLRVS